MGRAGEQLLRTVAPDYVKGEASLPVLGKVELTFSQDYRLFFGYGKSLFSPSEFRDFVSQASKFDFLTSGKAKLGFKAGLGASAGWFTERGMDSDRRSEAIAGANLNIVTPVGFGFSQSLPETGSIRAAPRAIEFGTPSKFGAGISGAGQVCDILRLLKGGGC